MQSKYILLHSLHEEGAGRLVLWTAHPGGGGGGIGGVAPVGVAVPGEEEGGRDQAWARLSSVQHSHQSQLITGKLWRHPDTVSPLLNLYVCRTKSQMFLVAFPKLYLDISNI